MSKKIFTEKEIEQLSTNKYVKSVSTKGITYTDEFKHTFITEKEKGKLTRDIFERCGFDVEVLGMDRVYSASKRWQKAYKLNGIIGLRDTRAENSGRSRERELTLEERNARLEAQINLLKAENELLKKIRFAERGMRK
ncbi:transposase [Bacillus freudenreichii]|nr:transposase [Bacillus freudenreichii]VEF46500.1 transposase [Bacillus freudenreichii]VEF48894.1 transposase [Bacillus freudenreichii]